ncbi:MAG: hypothetical protein PUP93_31480 [Rhizonema sp. NSF051]|nr:hypothetical protein [Rhizonema sp. NSF051]
MANLFSKTISRVSNLLSELQVKRFISVLLVGFLLLTTNVAPGSNKALADEINSVVHQDGSQRPKTTGEWNKDARETEGNPGERAKKIGQQSAEAVKDFGSLYPDTAERSANAE